MILRNTLQLLSLLTLSSASEKKFEPNVDSARENSYGIFNTIHSAGRQWGAGIYHNGFTMFPAVVPAGTVFYHGARSPERPKGLEWLAFEIEHGEFFAASISVRKRHESASSTNNITPRDSLDQFLLGKSQTASSPDQDDSWPHQNIRGYLHTYRTQRDLKVLYFDGMSAGKTRMGTLDTQDLVMREGKGGQLPFDEGDRAESLCKELQSWGYDGFVRTEMGFELVHCNFADGIDLLSVKRSFLLAEKMGSRGPTYFDLARAVSERYDGVGAHRLQVDFSSTVSGLFFPVNISSLNHSHPDWKRLAATPMKDLIGVKSVLKDIMHQPRRFTVNWQTVVDMIITRYSEGLAFMIAPETPNVRFVSEIERAVLTHINAPPLPEDVNFQTGDEADTVLEECTEHYFYSVKPIEKQWSQIDHLIYAALRTVTHDICDTLLRARSKIISNSPTVSDTKEDIRRKRSGLLEIRTEIKKLTQRLGWTTWRKVRPCPSGEIPYVVMWPFGNKQDYYTPGCRSVEYIMENGHDYWDITPQDSGPVDKKEDEKKYTNPEL